MRLYADGINFIIFILNKLLQIVFEKNETEKN
jgi:hypothetical protein